jgi:hypothetical protein
MLPAKNALREIAAVMQPNTRLLSGRHVGVVNEMKPRRPQAADELRVSFTERNRDFIASEEAQ